MYHNLTKLQLNRTSKLVCLQLNRLITIETSKCQVNHESDAGAAVFRENFASRHIGITEKDEAEMDIRRLVDEEL